PGGPRSTWQDPPSEVWSTGGREAGRNASAGPVTLGPVRRHRCTPTAGLSAWPAAPREFMLGSFLLIRFGTGRRHIGVGGERGAKRDPVGIRTRYRAGVLD